MLQFTINYGNGLLLTNPYENLAAAKQTAREEMSYTQTNVSIIDQDGHTVARSEWVPFEPTDEQEEQGLVLERFGNSGFYLLWDDELETLF